MTAFAVVVPVPVDAVALARLLMQLVKRAPLLKGMALEALALALTTTVEHLAKISAYN